MLLPIAPEIWHKQYGFAVAGVPAHTRMTIVRLADASLWVHSPVPLSSDDLSKISGLGEVKFIVAPNLFHHLFVAETQAIFPDAILLGARGLSKKRPDLRRLKVLSEDCPAEWRADLDQAFVQGIPSTNETAWFHKSSKTLILTDLCHWWRGELPFAAKLLSGIAGVRDRLAVPRMISWRVKDRPAARKSVEKILQWPFERVVFAHNSMIEEGAHDLVRLALERAF